MKASKKDVENAILFFAKKFGQEKIYKEMIESFRGVFLPKAVESIVCEMFLQKFDPYFSTKEEYDNCLLIHECEAEMRNNDGWVRFSE